jgi:diguanylate cyclase (GGDEF)-like protein
MLNREQGTILVVDDSQVNSQTLSQVLSSAGFKVRMAANGESAILQVHQNPPDLILLDIMMPGINGFDTCIQLKANPTTREIPIIFITAFTDAESKVKGLSLGGVDYVTKPFHEAELLARVNVHLKLRFLSRKVAQQAAALKAANDKLQRLADIDGLTQVANRRRFDEFLNQEWHRLKREQTPLSLILCDVDYFKLYNDRYGHLAGDKCLKQIAQALEKTVKRPADLVARYGGEEFAVILPNTELSGAVQVAEMIRSAIKKLKIVHQSSPIDSYVTVSMGISTQIPLKTIAPQSLLASADSALYEAKNQGRNCYFLGNPIAFSIEEVL